MMKLSVGDPSIIWNSIQPQSDEKTVVIIDGTTVREVGYTTEAISVFEFENEVAVRRVQTLSSREIGNRVTTSEILRSNFQPISHLDESDEQKISIRYDGTRVIGKKRVVGGEDTHIERFISSGVFDYHTLEMIIRLLPFKEKYTVDVPVYHAQLDQELDVKVGVIGIEKVDVGLDALGAWVVETDWGYVRQWYWIGMKDKLLLRQSMFPREGFEIHFVRKPKRLDGE
ncbi:MAG: hypothetical protein GTO18_12595 [Anaerolineales bacterium]|nr:hypothetical protein [Anaerolineales bacterium]